MTSSTRGGRTRHISEVLTVPYHEHVPKLCSSCGAKVFWAQLESGRSMPVDAEPNPAGNVILFDRGGSVVARVLRKGEMPPPGATLRTSHFAACPNAEQHRRRR